MRTFHWWKRRRPKRPWIRPPFPPLPNRNRLPRRPPRRQPRDSIEQPRGYRMRDQPFFSPRLQRYRDYTRQRQMTLGDLLLENRIIFLEGVINDAMANLTVMKLLYLQYENRTQGISFYINSPGGSV